MIEVKEETIAIKSEQAIDMFCTMAEIVSSAHLNKAAAVSMLTLLPTNLLLHFCDGLLVLNDWTKEILKDRAKNPRTYESDDEAEVRKHNDVKQESATAQTGETAM